MPGNLLRPMRSESLRWVERFYFYETFPNVQLCCQVSYEELVVVDQVPLPLLSTRNLCDLCLLGAGRDGSKGQGE